MVRSYIVDDPVKQKFLLDREALVSGAVLADEMAKIFAKCWIYVGHASELKKANDFVTRKVAGRPIIGWTRERIPVRFLDKVGHGFMNKRSSDGWQRVPFARPPAFLKESVPKQRKLSGLSLYVHGPLTL